MSIYRFGADSLIDEVHVHHSEGGGVRAYLHASNGADPTALEKVKETLVGHALQWTPILEDGKPLLEVRGFGKHESDLLRILQQSQALTGGYTTQHTVDDNTSLADRARSNTLKLSGYTYFVGDAGFLYYSAREAFKEKGLKNPAALAAGIFYAVGSPFLVFFGRGDKSDLQLKHMSYNLINDLKAKGIEVPQDSAVHAVANGHNATRWKKIKSFCERYPAEIANSAFGLAGGMIIWDKVKDLKSFDLTPLKNLKGTHRWQETMKFLKQEQRVAGQSAHSPKSVITDIGLGAATVLAGLISVFVEEEVPDPHKKKERGVMALLQKVKEHPLAAAGAALGVATIGHGASTWVDYKQVGKDLKVLGTLSAADQARTINLKKALPGRAVFTVTNLAAEGLMAMSSKGHGAGVKSDRSLERSAYAVTADLIARAPEEKQEAMLTDLSQFLAHRKHLAGDPSIIARGIREQLANLKQNPWVGGGTAMPQVAADEDRRWRGRITAPPAWRRRRFSRSLKRKVFA